MAQERTDGQMSRRELLVAGAVAAAGVSSLLLPDEVRAADGETLVAGAVRTSTTETGTKLADGTLKGVFLANDLSPLPTLTTRAGVYGECSNAQDSGVCGIAKHASAAGVRGGNFSGGVAVRGYASGGSGAGVEGVSEGTGASVRAHRADNGLALQVTGKSAFSRSGRGMVPVGKYSAYVTVPSGLSTASLVLVTLQNAGTGVYLKYARRTDETHFRVVLAKVAPSNTYFAWLVLN